MPDEKEDCQESMDETAELKKRLSETEDVLDAIRQYMVDAIVITRSNGEQVVTLTDASFPYRMMVESMNEGAVTLVPDGTIFYSNPCFGLMVGTDSEKLIGIPFRDLIPPEEQHTFDTLLKETGKDGLRGEFHLQTNEGKGMPVQLSFYRLTTEDVSGVAILATDITERIRAEKKIRSLASELTLVEQEERHRLSQILHDDLQQRLFAIRTHLSFLKDANGAQVANPERNSSIDQLLDWLSEAINITRNLSVNLSPIVLHGDGLAEAVTWLASQMKDQYGLEVEVEATENFGEMDEHMRVLLFQAVRELLFNVVKHAGLLQAAVRLYSENGSGWILVSDHGAGFDGPTMMKDHQAAHGLLIIKDRLGLMGCDMQVDSQPGTGTHVRIKVPSQEMSSKI